MTQERILLASVGVPADCSTNERHSQTEHVSSITLHVLGQIDPRGGKYHHLCCRKPARLDFQKESLHSTPHKSHDFILGYTMLSYIYNRIPISAQVEMTTLV